MARFLAHLVVVGWLAQLAERRSLAGELTLFYPRVTTMWVNRPL